MHIKSHDTLFFATETFVLLTRNKHFASFAVLSRVEFGDSISVMLTSLMLSSVSSGSSIIPWSDSVS